MKNSTICPDNRYFAGYPLSLVLSTNFDFLLFQDSVIPANNERDISLDRIPEDHGLLKFKKLDDEGKKALDSLLEFLGSPHISRLVEKLFVN